jgi:N utilization substance protein A
VLLTGILQSDARAFIQWSGFRERILSEQIAKLIGPIADELGYELVRVQIQGGARRATLQIMAERRDRTAMIVEDCARLSRAISNLLDEVDPIAGEYTLEVSSPGIDRPLMKRADYERFLSHEVKIETNTTVDGRKRFHGVIAALDGDTVMLDSEGTTAPLPLAQVKSAKLVLTDRLIAAVEDESAAAAAILGEADAPSIHVYGSRMIELLQVADQVAREKNIDREEVVEAMEQAIQKAGRSKYGHEHDIRATIDRRTGEISLKRMREVAETIENEITQISLEDARFEKSDAQIGDFLVEDLPPIDFGRIPAQMAKQVIVQRVRDAERQRQFREYKDRVGEIANGIVKRVEYGNVTVELGRAEAILRRDETLPREHFKNGDRVRAYIYDVREEPRGPQIFLSRTHPQFMAKLFMQEVPEIYDGIITIKSVARDPGSRAKIGVVSKDSSIDPVGACVGMRGSRVQAVVGELQGEKIDIIPWSNDPATFVVNALAPAEVTKVVLDDISHRIEVVVPDDQLSQAIGRRGQNVRLASMLTGWDIDILTEAEESERRVEETKTRSALFIEALDVDDVIAHLLVAEGFTSVEEIAFTEIEELAQIEGFDEDVAAELRDRALAYLEQRDAALSERRVALGVSDEVAAVEGLSPTMLVALGEKEVKTLDDLGDLATDELVEIVGAEAMTAADAEKIIMAARAHWFADEAPTEVEAQ